MKLGGDFVFGVPSPFWPPYSSRRQLKRMVVVPANRHLNDQ